MSGFLAQHFAHNTIGFTIHFIQLICKKTFENSTSFKDRGFFKLYQFKIKEYSPPKKKTVHISVLFKKYLH